MAEIKTKRTDETPAEFLARIEDPKRREDCRRLMSLMTEATGWEPAIWGPAIVGFGNYKYKSGKNLNDWFVTGFSPRKQNLTLYLMGGIAAYKDLTDKLGKFKTTGTCVYLKSLEDVDTTVLRELVKRSSSDLIRNHGTR